MKAEKSKLNPDRISKSMRDKMLRPDPCRMIIYHVCGIHRHCGEAKRATATAVGTNE